MNSLMQIVSLLILATLPVAAAAETPPMPALTNGDGNSANNGMKHIGVSLSGGSIGAHIATQPPGPVAMISRHGVNYTPDKFNVLEDVYFNAQHGWLPDGFFDELPADGSIWIARTAAHQPAGSTFKVYEGGNMAEGTESWSMREIYDADGASWQWDGLMQHDYFTADAPGAYSMSFEVYVGDSVGDPIESFAPGSATLEFLVVPEPSTTALAVVVGLLLILRRRKSTSKLT